MIETEKLTELLFALSNKLLEITTVVRANSLLQDSHVFQEIEELQIRTNDMWREVMKQA